jgi:uncharacterized protein with HEPN domain
MPPPNDPSALFDIVDAAERALFAIRGLTEDEYAADWVVRSVVERQLITCGEAVKRLTITFRDAHPTVPWKAVAGLRDVLVHAYDVIDSGQVWQAVTVALPDLLEQVRGLLASREPTD